MHVQYKVRNEGENKQNSLINKNKNNIIVEKRKVGVFVLFVILMFLIMVLMKGESDSIEQININRFNEQVIIS